MTDDSTLGLPGEVDLGRWRKASFSSSGECLEVADTGDAIALRNSNKPAAGTLFLRRSVLAAWIRGCKAAEFDDLTA